MTKIHAVGIDLGTTYSAVARIDETGRSAMVRNASGDLLTPSVVLFDDHEVIVGKEAKKAAGIETDRVAECVKRDMGSPTYSRAIRGELLPPEVIQSCILRRLKDDIIAALGPSMKVVITVPAYFDEPRRKATADAAEMAGLDLLDIVNEPTAAALAFGEHLGYLDPTGSPREPLKVLVYDLGGGTFDVTVIELRPGDLRTLATDGDVRLGGRDWDGRLLDYVAGEFSRELFRDPRSEPSSAARLLRAVEEAKHTLSARDHATVHVEFAGQARDIVVSREKLESLCEDLLERTAYTSRQVMSAAGLDWSSLSYVLLVGGSTRMPMVEKMLERLTGRKPQHVVHPDEAVARGAAIFAGYLLSSRDERMPGARFQVTDVNSHSLGIEGIDQRTLRKENVILIPRNSPLPCSKSEKFVTKSDGQKSVVVQVLEGESKVPEQCSPIGRAVMRSLPPNLPKGTRVDVSYEYGTNGRLSVRARVNGAPQQLNIELEREQGMSDERVARWKQLVTSDRGFQEFSRMLEPRPGDLPLGASPTIIRPAPGAATPLPARRPVAVGAAASGNAPIGNFPAGSVRVTSGGAAVGNVPKGSAPLQSAPTPGSAAAMGATAGAMANLAAGGSSGETVASVPQPVMPSTFESTAGAEEFNSPQVPFNRLSPDEMRARQRRKQMRMIFNLVGHVVSSVLGLVLGYWILCIISPQSNFLKLSLPGVTAPTEDGPASGTQPPSGPAKPASPATPGGPAAQGSPTQQGSPATPTSPVKPADPASPAAP